MICINIHWLSLIGLADLGGPSDLDRQELLQTAGGGLAFSPLFAFDAIGHRGGYDRDTEALRAEPRPRALLLVGMMDPYHAGTDLAESVTTVCVAPDGREPRAPHRHEASALAADLERCTHSAAERIRARLLELAGPDTEAA